MGKLNINLQAKNIEVTDAIRDYVEKRVTNLGKLLAKLDEDINVHFEVGKTTRHHKQGEVFVADCQIQAFGKTFKATSKQESLYAAVDEVKEILFRDIKRAKGRSRTLLERGARSLKKRLKGLKPW